MNMKNIKGIFAVDKPVGISSQKAVQIVKYWARRKTGDKKIKVGHGGTLDPLASGVLVVAVGREHTKQIDKIVKSEKEYTAEIYLGEVSSTDDAEGEKTVVNKIVKPSKREIEKVLQQFVGKIEQVPPTYSAIKIDGQEAYKRVRRGEEIEMKKRTVEIKNIEILDYNYPKLRLRVACGKGTYIRSLARDIGESLEIGAYLSGLTRTKVGNFKLSSAKQISDFALKIAIHGSELDGGRVDGTKVYISEVLKRIGSLGEDDEFHIYHKGKFNRELQPPKCKNYHIKTLAKMPLWTQTVFAGELWKTRPDVAWLPFHNMPLFRPSQTKIISTIHDLAFKLYPETFPKNDLRKLNFLTDLTVKRANHLIAVSKSSKRDLLKFYPELTEDKISVVHLGVNLSDWRTQIKGDIVEKTLNKYNLISGEYLVSVGAIQPRKNLKVFIDAFEKVKKIYPQMKLVLVGGNGWLWGDTHNYAQRSKYGSDIIFTEGVSFLEVKILLKNAKVFVFPSLYEGFGIGGLEAMASGVPVVAGRNSSLPEVLGSSAQYFDAQNSDECATKILQVLQNAELQNEMIKTGLKRAEKFTWDKCARETLRVLRKI